MEAYGGKEPQAVLTVGLLLGLDGVDKMSKSKGNHVGITDEPDDMFGKVMSISDALMAGWYPLLTGKEIDQIGDPLVQKKALAKVLVERFHGVAAAADTFSWWEAGRPPRNVEEVRMPKGPLFSVVHKAGGATSGGDARRKIAQGGVSLNGERWSDAVREVPPGSYLLQVGKKWAAKIIVG
jgi:tyrosyl-tRNA synthetase